MDPHEALERVRAAVFAVESAGNPWDAAQAGQDLAEAFSDLDQWLSGGGFPPEAWTFREAPGWPSN